MIKQKIINIFFILLFTIILTNYGYAELTFKSFDGKKVSYLDFFLLKLENKLIARSQILKAQLIATRVQYSNIVTQVDFNSESDQIFTDIYAIMSKSRYSKKNYNQKLSDCNQVRNLIFYRKNGYKFFTQKRDPSFSESVMVDIFKEVFFNNLDLEEKEINFLLDKMFVKVTIFHPIKKTELTCVGKINDYELK